MPAILILFELRGKRRIAKLYNPIRNSDKCVSQGGIVGVGPLWRLLPSTQYPVPGSTERDLETKLETKLETNLETKLETKTIT